MAGDEVQVVLVGQHDIVEELDRELGELHLGFGLGFEVLALLLADGPAHAAGQTEDGVGGLAADSRLDLLRIGAVLDHLAAHRQPHLRHHAQDVALRRVGRRAEHEIGRGQGVEMGDMGVHIVRRVERAPLSCWRPGVGSTWKTASLALHEAR